jgi:protoporphyrinogen oxidase
LAAAYDLARAGHQADVFEGAPAAGGLAAGFKAEGWDWPLERFYHHLFTNDDDIIGLARQTGFGDRVITRRPVTALQFEGHQYALDSPVAVLRFPGIPAWDRLRLGLVALYLKTQSDWRSMESVTAHDWLRKWMGERCYRVVWEPMLIGKFGDYYRDIPMSWFWARIHKRTPSLGYFEGGFQAFADHLVTVVRLGSANVHLSTPVRAISPAATGLTVDTDRGAEDFDAVIATVGPHLVARMVPDLPADYLAELGRLKYMGAVVVVVALERPITRDVYWLTLMKHEFPFLAFVEHTNFMDRSHYGDQYVAYLGDYLPPEHRYFKLSEHELLAEWLPALRLINPEFDESWVQGHWLSRTPYAQPVVPLNFSHHIPALETPIAGLYWASMSQVYPWDRGTNYAVEIGRRVARLVMERR